MKKTSEVSNTPSRNLLPTLCGGQTRIQNEASPRIRGTEWRRYVRNKRKDVRGWIQPVFPLSLIQFPCSLQPSFHMPFVQSSPIIPSIAFWDSQRGSLLPFPPSQKLVGSNPRIPVNKKPSGRLEWSHLPNKNKYVGWRVRKWWRWLVYFTCQS